MWCGGEFKPEISFTEAHQTLNSDFYFYIRHL